MILMRQAGKSRCKKSGLSWEETNVDGRKTRLDEREEKRRLDFATLMKFLGSTLFSYRAGIAKRGPQYRAKPLSSVFSGTSEPGAGSLEPL